MAKADSTETPRKVRDPELKAIDKCVELLAELDDEQRERAMGFINSKFRKFIAALPDKKPTDA